MSDVTTTPVSGGVETSAATEVKDSSSPVKRSFNPSEYDPKELEAFIEAQKQKVRINGKDKEFTLAEMRKLASLAEASTEKFQSASQKEKEAQELKKAFESGDVRSALRKMGKQPQEIKKIMEDALLLELEEEALDPKDRELRDLKKEKEERLAREKEIETEKEAAKKSEDTKRLQSAMEAELVEALQGAALPKGVTITKHVVQLMLDAAAKGVELSAKDAATIAKKDLMEDVSKLLPALGVDGLKKLLGADLLKALRDDGVKEVKTQDTPFPKPAPKRKPESKPSKSDEPDQLGMSDYFKRLRRGGV
jgi:hypothetical protein